MPTSNTFVSVVLCALALGACSESVASSADASVAAHDAALHDASLHDAALPDATTADASPFDATTDATTADASAFTLDASSSGADAALVDASPDARVDVSHLYAPPDYASCDGNTFFPDGSCADGACAPTVLAARVYGVWKERFLAIHRLTEEQFDARIEIANVELTDGPVYVWWRVDYVFNVDWVRSRQSESVSLGDFPLVSDPSDEDVTRAVNLAIETAERFDTTDVAQFSAVVDALVACSPYVASLDWCHIDFENVTGNLLLRARSRSPSDECKAIEIKLEDAVASLCVVDRCSIHGP